MPQTWNPARTDGGAPRLSNGNLTFTQNQTTGVYAPFVALNSFSSGKYYWEIRLDTLANADSDVAFGIANTTFVTVDANFLGIDANAMGWYHTIPFNDTGFLLANNIFIGQNLMAGFQQGDVLCIALDLDNDKIWNRKNGGVWNLHAAGTQDPATNQGGNVIPANLNGSNLVAPAGHTNTQGDVITARFLASSWGFAAPAGFGSTDPIATAVLRDFTFALDATDMAVIFRDFGATDPWASIFAPEFGPPADYNLAFGSTVSRDFGATGLRPWAAEFAAIYGPEPTDNALEFQGTLARNVAVVNEPLRTAIANSIAFFDTLSGTIIVSAGPTVTAEWVTTVIQSVGAPLDWQNNSSRDATIPSDAGALLSDDYFVPVEWGLSARRDNVVPIDFNTTRIASPIAPVEWRTTLIRDTVVPGEPNAVAAFSTPVPAEWSSGTVVTSALAPVEFGAGRFSDAAMPAEIPGFALSDAVAPIDFGQPAQMSASFTVPIEFDNRIFAFYAEPGEFGGSAARSATVPAEWTGAVGVTLDIGPPLEWRGGFTSDQSAPIDMATLFTADAPPMSVEWRATMLQATAVSIEFKAITLDDARIVIDIGAGVRASSAPALEIKASSYVDAVVPQTTGGSATGTTADAAAPVEFGQGSASPNYPIADETQATPIKDTVMPIYSVTSFISDPAVATESTLSVVGESFVIPDNNFDVITTNAATSVEWSMVGITSSTTFPVERLAGAAGDSAISADWFGVAISVDVLTLIEWTHDTSVTTADAATPIEFLTMTVVDVQVATELWFGRKSIGTELEPDEWERERD